jgi:proteasome lid subunit RPN8/RPN11
MRIEQHLPQIRAGLHLIAGTAKPREACGIVCESGKLCEFPNRAADPTQDFDLGPLHALPPYYGAVAAIWHTHPDDEPPSPMDLANCRATALPWIIAGPNKLWAIHPQHLPLSGRDFVYGVEDCWQCVADWFAQEKSLFLPWFPRPPDGWWEEAGPSPYIEAATAYGFTVRTVDEAGFSSLKAGDVLLMQIAGKRANHAAVYVGGGYILHHLYGCLSVTELLDEGYQRRTTHIGRHLSLA